jgi:polyisoprenoid-binding protein YceI
MMEVSVNRFTKLAAGAVALSLMAGGAVVAQSVMTKNPAEVQSGTYALDASHGKITYYVDHLGFSTYVGQFTGVEAQLVLDSANPTNSTLTASIPLAKASLDDEGLNRHLQTADFFDVANHPVASFRSTRIVLDDEDKNEADVYGELTLRGVTREVKIEVEFNQAGANRGTYRAGFDGEAKIKRSDFGITYGLPAIGDEIKLRIEGEFLKQ